MGQVPSLHHTFFNWIFLGKGPFKYYVIKEVGGWGQIMAKLGVTFMRCKENFCNDDECTVFLSMFENDGYV